MKPRKPTAKSEYPRPSLTFQPLGDPALLVCYHGTGSASEHEWEAFLEALGASLANRHAHGSLIVTEGGHPTRAQQGRLQEVTRGRVVPTAVISDSALVRFLSASMGLGTPGVKVFAPANFQQALRYLGVEGYARAIRSAVQSLRSQVIPKAPAPDWLIRSL